MNPISVIADNDMRCRYLRYRIPIMLTPLLPTLIDIFDTYPYTDGSREAQRAPQHRRVGRLQSLWLAETWLGAIVRVVSGSTDVCIRTSVFTVAYYCVHVYYYLCFRLSPRLRPYEHTSLYADPTSESTSRKTASGISKHPVAFCHITLLYAG